MFMQVAGAPPRKRMSLTQRIAFAVVALLLGGATSVALSSMPATAAAQAPVTAPTSTTCQEEETYTEYRYKQVTTVYTVEHKEITVPPSGAARTSVLNWLNDIGAIDKGSDVWQLPDDVVNAAGVTVVGPGAVASSGNVNLSFYQDGPNYDAPNVSVHYQITAIDISTTPPAGSLFVTTHNVTIYYVAGGSPTTTQSAASWVETNPGSPWVQFDERTQKRMVDVPCPPSVTLTGVAECDTSTGTYQVTYTGTAVNADPNTAEIDIKVIDATPSGTLINGQSGQVWLYEWVEHYANHNLPPFPVGGQFTFLQTGIPGTATSASATIQYDYKGGPSGDPKATVELGGDCETNVNWEVCTTFAAPTTVYTMSGWPVTDIRAPGVGEINDDQPRSGFGSLLLDTPTNPAKVQYVQPVEPFPLSDLIQMEYETYATASTVALPSLQLRYTSESKGLTGDFNFIAYEPYVDQGNAAIVPNTWQHWDAYQGGDALIWSNRGATLGIATQGAPVTFKELNDAVGDIMITGYVINRGSYNAGDAQYVDNVGFAKKGEACSVDNFEPKPTVVPSDPGATITQECSVDGGASATIKLTNPFTPAPNTVGSSETFTIKETVNGVTTTKPPVTVDPNEDEPAIVYSYPEDSGSYFLEVFDSEGNLLASATVDSNCADDVITTPAKLVPTPPTCFADGKPPVVPSTDGLHYTTKISAPSGTGPWMYTIVDTADEGYTFADSKYQVYGVTVYPQLTENCGLAYTGVALEKTATLAAGLFIIGFIAVMWQRRRALA